jgi:hypothetical protein
LLLLLTSVVILAIGSLIGRWLADKRARAIVGGTIGVFVGFRTLLLNWYLGVAQEQMFELDMLICALIIIAVSMPLILSDKMKKIVTQAVQKPPGLARWVDLYASNDPVPNGATVAGGHESIKIWDHESIKIWDHESIKIWNLGSMVADHTAYWDNRDGFVLRVATVCAETAQSPWSGALPRTSRFKDERAAWRVGFLRIARRSTAVTWLVLGAILWSRYQISIPVTFDLPVGFLPRPFDSLCS